VVDIGVGPHSIVGRHSREGKVSYYIDTLYDEVFRHIRKMILADADDMAARIQAIQGPWRNSTRRRDQYDGRWIRLASRDVGKSKHDGCV
jgi:hypothetical protein